MGAPGRAQAQAAATRRMIAMFTFYGCLTTRWFPTKSHGPLTAADLEPTTLKHLMPYVDRLLMPRGIRAMNEWTMDMSLGQGNDVHLNATGSYFTCQPLSPNSNEPTLPLDSRLEQLPIGRSVDHVMAEQLSPNGQPLVLNVGHRFAKTSAVSFSAEREAFPAIQSPRQIFTALTGLFDGSGSPASYQALRGKSVLDLIRGDLATLSQADMSAADREKLEAWKELLHETSQTCSEEMTARLGLSEDLVARAPTTFGIDISASLEGSTLDLADLYSDLTVLAAICNANPVMMLVYPPDHVYQGLGITTDSNVLAHRVGGTHFSGECQPNVLEQLALIDDFYARKFAYLVGRLNEFSEGEGTLLDQTAAVWFQEVSDGAARNANNLPIVQVGSCGGYFKTGYAINVDDGSDSLTRGSSEIACAPGTPSEITASEAVSKITGTDRSLANAPINKYFCNLMNALGVRAGADGFAAVDGTEDVRCFGRYDRTEDFIGGDVNPPTIVDPGEFDELRA